jgi:formate--tetrahydrofolate ligase
VIVATIRALKMHGGIPKNELDKPDVIAVERGLPNLVKHCENMRAFGLPIVVSINRFVGDSDEEIYYLSRRCEELGLPAAVSNVWEEGGKGGVALAEKVIEAADTPSRLIFTYDTETPIKSKITRIATAIYGASGVSYADDSEKKIKQLEGLGFGNLPICMAKTQYSFSDDPNRLGHPTGFDITVRDAKVSAGAGFIVVYTGNVMTMPGLPKHPAAERIDVDENGVISGLF